MGRLIARVLSPRLVKQLTIAAALGMFLVLIQGSLVTDTGSADGCGNDWPLCNGAFVPQMAVSTAIEYSHRVVVSIETVLIVLSAVGALLYWRNRVEIRVLAPLMVVFLFAQAGLGAAAVKWPQSGGVLALHFGVSLIAFATTLLTAVFVHEVDDRDTLRDRPLPRYFAWAVWGLLGYTYLVVYIGAYVNHSHASLACGDWPLCNGSVFPGFSGPVGVAFGHRVAAAVLLTLTVALLWWATRLRELRPDLFFAAAVAFALVIAQAISGAFVVETRLDVFAALSHGIVVSLFFGTLSYMGLKVLPRPSNAHELATPNTRAEPALRARPAPGATGD
jgi:cytochrome c oxidase assembly protein subunit 15